MTETKNSIYAWEFLEFCVDFEEVLVNICKKPCYLEKFFLVLKSDMKKNINVNFFINKILLFKF